MTLSEAAVRRPVTTYMVFVGVLLVGAVSLDRIRIDLLPEIEFPSISIFATYEGVGPEEIETLLTRVIEEAVSTVQGVDRVESFSSEGRSRVRLQFDWGTSLDGALNDVRAAIERIRDVLPDDASSPVVFKFDLSSFPIMYLSLSGDMSPWRLRRLAEDNLKYRLERVEGVAAVDVRGGLRREVHVDLDGDRLAALGLSAAQVSEALRRDNVNLPAGDVRDRGDEVIVRVLGELRSVGQIGEVVVTLRDGRAVRVRDLGTVTDGYEKPTSTVLIDGKPGIRLAVSKLSGANTVQVAGRVAREVERINQDIPRITLKARFNTSDYIEQSIRNLRNGVLYGALLAIIVLLVFLRSVRATAIVATAIPIAVVGTFALMYLSGFTLNMISFGGLALGIGMLVDNAIVILENIQRHREAGRAPADAAVQGSREVSTAIIASTLTTLSIFVPVVFIGGFAGIFFGQLALVVSFSLLCSLAVALTLIPVLSSRTRLRSQSGAPPLRITAALGRFLTDLEQGYASFLATALRRRKTVYGLSVALLLVSAAAAPWLGVELMPEDDQGEIQVNGELPPGTPLERTEQITRAAEEAVTRNVPELESLMSVAGPRGFWSTAGSNAASLRIKLVDLADRQRSSDEVARALRAELHKLPDFKARVRAGEGLWLFRLLRGGGERISVNVLGFDVEVAAGVARDVAKEIRQVPGIVDVDVDRKEGQQEAVISIDADKAADVGLSVGQIANAVSTYVLGTAATYFRDAGDEYRVLVRLREQDRLHADQLQTLPLITPSGASVTLADVAHIERRQGPVSIRRLNQERIVTVDAGFAGRDLGSVMTDLRERLATVEVPEGFVVSVAGELEEQQRTFGQLIIGLLLALALVYMVMASLFESFLHPLIMLLSIPFAAIGVVATLWVSGTTLNVYSFMGIIVLCGVVVNNAIVLVDCINLLRRQQPEHPLADAVVEAARRRLRPILMTTLTTALALMPVAVGLGEGGELQAPLARVVVGGLLTSTLITLVFVPALYVTASRLTSRFSAPSSSPSP